MKVKYLYILIVTLVLNSCGIQKRIFSVVSNKFPIVDSPTKPIFEKWDNSNLYILRLELEEGNKVLYSKNGDTVTELTDYPVKDYKLLIKPDWNNQNVVEEVYLYLSNFNKSSESGKVLYMSSMPLKPKTSELIFCNNFFVSTYGINHLMVGDWALEENNLRLNLTDKKDNLELKGKWFKENKFIEITHTSHPKSMKKNDKRLIEIKDVFETNPNNDYDEYNKVKGIRFFQNINRELLNPEWKRLGKWFDSEEHLKYYWENKEVRKIIEVMIPETNKKEVFFKLNDIDSDSQKNTIIRYR